MTKDEAVDLLGLDTEFSGADVERRYQALYNDYQFRLAHAPTPALKKTYQKNLRDLQAAAELLAPGTTAVAAPDLPSSEPARSLDVTTSTVRTTHHEAAKQPDRVLPRSTMIALGVAAILAGLASFFAIVWIQERQPATGTDGRGTVPSDPPRTGPPLSPADEARKAAEVERMKLEVERTRLELEKARREDAQIVEEAQRAKTEEARRAEELRANAYRSAYESRIEGARRARAEQQGKWESTLLDSNGQPYPGVAVGIGAAAEGTTPVLTFFMSSKDLESGAHFRTNLALVNHSGEAAFRFRVLHVHARECRGFLYISPNRVAYIPVDTPQFKADAFEFPRDKLRRLGAKSNYFKIQTPNRDYDFVFSAQESGGKKTWWVGGPLREWAETALLDYPTARAVFEQSVADITNP